MRLLNLASAQDAHPAMDLMELFALPYLQDVGMGSSRQQRLAMMATILTGMDAQLSVFLKLVSSALTHLQSVLKYVVILLLLGLKSVMTAS